MAAADASAVSGEGTGADGAGTTAADGGRRHWRTGMLTKRGLLEKRVLELAAKQKPDVLATHGTVQWAPFEKDSLLVPCVVVPATRLRSREQLQLAKEALASRRPTVIVFWLGYGSFGKVRLKDLVPYKRRGADPNVVAANLNANASLHANSNVISGSADTNIGTVNLNGTKTDAGDLNVSVAYTAGMNVNASIANYISIGNATNAMGIALDPTGSNAAGAQALAMGYGLLDKNLAFLEHARHEADAALEDPLAYVERHNVQASLADESEDARSVRSGRSSIATRRHGQTSGALFSSSGTGTSRIPSGPIHGSDPFEPEWVDRLSSQIARRHQLPQHTSKPIPASLAVAINGADEIAAAATEGASASISADGTGQNDDTVLHAFEEAQDLAVQLESLGDAHRNGGAGSDEDLHKDNADIMEEEDEEDDMSDSFDDDEDDDNDDSDEDDGDNEDEYLPEDVVPSAARRLKSASASKSKEKKHKSKKDKKDKKKKKKKKKSDKDKGKDKKRKRKERSDEKSSKQPSKRTKIEESTSKAPSPSNPTESTATTAKLSSDQKGTTVAALKLSPEESLHRLQKTKKKLIAFVEHPELASNEKAVGKAVQLLQELAAFPITETLLRQTEIGPIVASLRSHENDQVKSYARALRSIWKEALVSQQSQSAT
mmetsp:Transcript_18610/g.33027  ORF Transcript_18610/g.33027 Transcript_18610/m.33027 type:complete len:662 (-) Transcript_18610:261-2246(-)|eukprot:CAMPEP_0171547432 /NCGR_PEP_ID=MMETSP0960-20121227/5211_1 /TAXON_ID=87120 /ORGANISM="Aurantiochytrium limacinum, Strain ATCCMYA-1381" /LENGTH=661 /DNA_ID=CAMNT_0012095667 /DNA_START=35 /DNA_END=2020 /DNA_ORIENTATION=+